MNIPGRSLISKMSWTNLRLVRGNLIITALLLLIIIIINPALFWLCIIGFALVVFVTSIALPMTNVRKLRQMVERRQQRTWPRNAMKSIAESLSFPVFILDRENVLRFANTASKSVFGPVNEGDPISFKFRTPQIVELVETVTATGLSQSMIYEEQTVEKRWFEVKCIPVRKFKNPTGVNQPSNFFLLTFADLTQIRRTEQMRSDFVANASHELRTPLTSLRGFIETMQGPAKDDEKAKEEFLAVMFEQTERMSRLIDDLLSLSHIEAKAHIRPLGKVNLGLLLASVNETLQPTAKKYGTKLTMSGFKEDVEVTGDHDELFQVFQNLIENACKYGREKGDVDVVLAQNGSDHQPVCVEIRDNGFGIESQHIPRLTERFYRAPNKNSKALKGTGLGLAIVKHILNRHNASFQMASTLGKGTIASVKFSN